MTLTKSRTAIDPRCCVCGDPIPWPPLDPARVPMVVLFGTTRGFACVGCAEGSADMREPWRR